MIDAYEIGIQLALQDGVSAGLEVVARELAELDRAVAASSAGLVALTRTAEAARQAVAAVAGVRVPAPAAGGPIAAEAERAPVAAQGAARVEAPASPDVAAPRAGATEGGPARVADAGGRTEAVPIPTRAVVVEQRPVVAAAPPQAAPVGGRPERRGPAGAIVQQQVVAAMPAVAAAPGGGEAVAPSGTVPAPAPVAAMRVASRAEPVRVPVRTAPVAEPSVSGERAGDVAPPVRAAPVQVAPVRAEVGRAAPVAAVPGQGGGARTVASQQVPTAPMGSWPQVPAAPAGGGFMERATAPMPESQGRGEQGGGAVMLDGRLVGHWLTERMAREAARPPSGTSFFDPRQAPAWAPSGVL